MGQIVGAKAKPKRANLNALGLISTAPANGEIILVSSDNSMDANGQGNFDSYIVGDGTTAAASLDVIKINEEFYMQVPKTITEYETTTGYIYRDGTVVTTSYTMTLPIAVNVGDEITFSSACYGDTAALAFSTNPNATVWTVLLLGTNNNAASTQEYTVTSNGYVVFSFNSAKSFSILINSSEKVLKYDPINSVIEDDSRSVKSSGIYDFVTTGITNTVITSANENVGYISRNGQVVVLSSGDYRYTDPIPVMAGASLNAFFGCYGDTAAVSFSTESSPSAWQVLQLGAAGSGDNVANYTQNFSEDGYVVLSYNSSKTVNFTITTNKKVVPWCTDSDVDKKMSDELSSDKYEELSYVAGDGYIDRSGNIVTSLYGLSQPIFIESGTYIVVKAACYEDTAVIATAATSDASTWNVVKLGKTNKSLNVYYYLAPTDIWLRCSYNPTYGLKIYKKVIDKSNDFIETPSVLGTKEEKEFSSILGYIDYDGNIQSSDTVKMTEPIAVNRGDRLSFYSSVPSNTSILAFSADGTTWKRVVETLDGTRPQYTSAVAPEDGYFCISNSDSIKEFELFKFEKAKVADFAYTHGCRRFSNCKDFGTQPAANGSEGSYMNTSQNYESLLNSVYEPLRTSYPDYITRTNIGKDGSNTYDMYIYEFTPKYYTQCVILTGGVHADEPDAIACLARIMQLIAEGYSGDEDLTYLHYNVKFVVVPCINVWGYSQSTKQRTFSNGTATQTWANVPLPQELANLKPYLISAAKEASFHLDFHTTLRDTYNDFYGVTQRFCPNLRTIFRTNTWLCDNYAKDGRTVDDQYLGYLEGYPGLFSQYMWRVLGVPACTLELSDYHWDSSRSTSKVITMGVTMWLNYIIQMVNDCYNFIPYGIPIADYRVSKA